MTKYQSFKHTLPLSFALVFILACGAKDRGTLNKSPEPAALESRTEGTVLVSFSNSTPQKREILTQENSGTSLSAPLVVPSFEAPPPSSVPQRLKFDFRTDHPKIRNASRSELKIDLDPQALSARIETDPHLTSVEFDLSQSLFLSRALGTLGKVTFELQTFDQSSGSPLFKIHGTFVAPPPRLPFERLPISTIPHEARHFKQGDAHYYLIAAFKTEAPTTLGPPSVLQITPKPTTFGTLSQEFTLISHRKGLCQTQTQRRTEVQTNELELQLRPLFKEVTQITVVPQKPIELGLFASSPEMDRIMSLGSRKDVFYKERVVAGCDAWCGFDPERPDLFGYLNPQGMGLGVTLNDFQKTSPECARYLTHWNEHHGQVYGFDDREARNHCAEWDLSRGYASSDSKNRICLGNQGSEGWNLRQTFEEREAGTQASPIKIKLSQAARTLVVGYPFEPEQVSPQELLPEEIVDFE